MSSQFEFDTNKFLSELFSPEAKRDRLDCDWAEEVDKSELEMNKRQRDVNARRESQELPMGSDLKSVLDAIEGLKGSLDGIRAEIADLKAMNAKVTKNENEIRGVRNDLNYALIDSVKKWVVIKGLKKHANAQRFESRDQTLEVLSDFTKFLRVDVTFSDYMRLPDFIQGTNLKVGVIRAEFLTVDNKLDFFRALSGVTNKEQLKGISVDQELPRFLLPQKKLLETEAYNLRKTQKVKTRVIVKKTKLVLQSRAREDGANWVTVNTGGGHAES